jgi:SAM-dependent methyltransferase
LTDLERCALCGSSQRDVLYAGPIRTGRFGEVTPDSRTVWRCLTCGAGRLGAEAVDYETDEYRNLVDGGGTAEDYHRLHDAEQADKLSRLGSHALRGKVLMDVGCGAGSFLDLARGYCQATIGIEPSSSLRAAAAAKGHVTFDLCRHVSGEWRGRVDLAVCFSVVEHVDDPLALLREIAGVLRPGGQLLLSTPNRDDFLLELLPAEYGAFFYRRVHLWYFDAASLAGLLARAGFRDPVVTHQHRFDLSNAALWLRDRRPTGLGKLNAPTSADEVFRALLQASGRSDYLYCRCGRGD